jgi:hypothetical protein
MLLSCFLAAVVLPVPHPLPYSEGTVEKLFAKYLSKRR